MDIPIKRDEEPKGVRAGLILGFAAPLLFLGSLPRYDSVRTDNVSRSWREVGNTLSSTMAYERSRLRDRRR